MEFGVMEILLQLCVLIFVIYFYMTWNFDFWKKRNVKGPKPIPLFGNFKDVIFGNIHLAFLVQDYYNKYKSERMIGIFKGQGKPSLILRDPDLIKDVFIKDFNTFPDRGRYINEKDPLSQNLINLGIKEWRPLRHKLSPIFTAKKLREMYHILEDCVKNFEFYLEDITSKNCVLECRELTNKFTTQSIATCCFGLNINAFDDENGELTKFCRALCARNLADKFRRLLQDYAPRIYEILGPYKHVSGMNIFVKSMKEIIHHRRTSKDRRNDFVDFLMDLQNQEDEMGNTGFSDIFMIGQALSLFFGGFEAPATVMTSTFYELALNTDLQDTLRSEIHDEIERDNGKLTFDTIKRMKYLDKVVKESLRKYPNVGVIQRVAADTYTFRDTKVTIPKDTYVMIPIWAIQRDPSIYPDPDKYDPERFNEENEKNRHPMNYLPFGGGPHICIGYRFANYVTKMGIIAVINKFRVDVCEKTCTSIQFSTNGFSVRPIGGIYLKISKV